MYLDIDTPNNDTIYLLFAAQSGSVLLNIPEEQLVLKMLPPYPVYPVFAAAGCPQTDIQAYFTNIK